MRETVGISPISLYKVNLLTKKLYNNTLIYEHKNKI